MVNAFKRRGEQVPDISWAYRKLCCHLSGRAIEEIRQEDFLASAV